VLVVRRHPASGVEDVPSSFEWIVRLKMLAVIAVYNERYSLRDGTGIEHGWQNISGLHHSRHRVYLCNMPDKLQVQEEEDYDLDAALDGPVVSNFLEKDRENISPRELTFRKDEPSRFISEEPSYPLASVMAFIMACCLAHLAYILLTKRLLGTVDGWSKLDEFAARVKEFFAKHSITIPEGIQL